MGSVFNITENMCLSILESTYQGVLITEKTSKRFKYANPAMCKMLGYGADELLKLSVSDIHPTENLQEVLSRFNFLAEGKKSHVKASPCKRKDGTVVWTEIGASNFLFNGIECNVGFFTDITERKKDEERLRLMVDLLDLSPASITIHDLDGNFLYANRKTFELHGYTKEEFFKLKLFELDAPESARLIEPRIRDIIRTGEGSFEAEHLCKDGSVLPLHVFAKITEWDGKRILLSVALDNRERKRAEEELQKAQKLESLGILASGIAHDFNNLLGGLFGFIDLARHSISGNPAVRDYLDRAMQCFSSAKDLTQQLLTFSKGGAPQKKAVSIAPLIEGAVNLSLSGSNIKCRRQIASDIFSVKADQGQISQVLNNVLLNSRQAMPNGGQITIIVRNEELSDNLIAGLHGGKFISISITDTGSGISKDIIFKVFDPFFTTKRAGSGLGLATSYSIIKKHGGHITIESDLGTGTTVTILLPAATDMACDESQKKTAELKGEGRILLMDDEEIIGVAVGRLLNVSGYEVAWARNGEEAVALYEKSVKTGNKFLAVILDLTVIGGMDGEKTIRRLLEIDPDVKAIASSGYSESAVFANPKKYGFLGGIAKPYQKNEILKLLSDIVKVKK